MNERNAAALEALYEEWERAMRDDAVDEVPSLGEFMAARGVLVPSALSDDQAASITADWDSGQYMGLGLTYTPLPEPMPRDIEKLTRGAAVLRAALEAIAKGEPR